MLPEALVIWACVNSTGCSETSSHYYNINPEVRKIIEKNEKKVERFIGPHTIRTFGPIIYTAAGGTGTMRLYRDFSLQISTKKGILLFSREF